MPDVVKATRGRKAAPVGLPDDGFSDAPFNLRSDVVSDAFVACLGTRRWRAGAFGPLGHRWSADA